MTEMSLTTKNEIQKTNRFIYDLFSALFTIRIGFIDRTESK